MNTEGCPALWATDEILIYGDRSESCTLLIPVWLTVVSICCLWRAYVASLHWRNWFARQRKQKSFGNANGHDDVHQRKFRRRLPVVPLLSTLVTISQILFVVLASTNTVSSRNGTSAIVAAIWFFPQQCVNQLFNLKLIRLGRKICPMRPLDGSGSDGPLLSNFDFLQRLLMKLWMVTTFGHMVCAILVPAIPSRDAFRAEFILIVGLNICTIFSEAHQFTRVIHSIEQQTFRAQAMSGIAGNNQGGGVAQAVHKLKFQRAIVIVCFFPLMAMVVYVCVTLNFHWFLLISFMFLELFILIMFSRSMNGGRKRSKQYGRNGGGDSTNTTNKRASQEMMSTNPTMQGEIAGGSTFQATSSAGTN